MVAETYPGDLILNARERERRGISPRRSQRRGSDS
jgi:hypothetical protein